MISKDEVKHIAGLARIGLDEAEIGGFSKELSAILSWVEKLKEADIKNISPMARITGRENISREDRVSDFSEKDGIIKLFPEEKDGYDKVKSVL